MLTIELKNLSFYAYHGLYQEEKIIGNTFIINLSVSYIPTVTVIKNIEETINYVSLYEIVKHKMSVTTPLLETVAMEVAEDIYKAFPQIKKIAISIAKAKLPIENFVGDTVVIFTKEF